MTDRRAEVIEEYIRVYNPTEEEIEIMKDTSTIALAYLIDPNWEMGVDKEGVVYTREEIEKMNIKVQFTW